MKDLDQGFPTWGTSYNVPQGVHLSLKGYIYG